MRKDEAGLLAVPMSLALVILATAALALLFLMARWRELARTQLRLDACVGRAALDLKAAIQSVEKANTRMRVLRASLAAATVAPPARAALQAALSAESVAQELRVRAWQLKRVRWALDRNACGDARDWRLALPDMPWRREPPDALGPRPLRWDGDTAFKFAARAGPRWAAAWLEGGKKREWKAEFGFGAGHR